MLCAKKSEDKSLLAMMMREKNDEMTMTAHDILHFYQKIIIIIIRGPAGGSDGPMMRFGDCGIRRR
jgi:hypothetical protein